MRQGARGVQQHRLEQAKPQRAVAFVRRYADTFGSVRIEPQSDANRVLIIGSGTVEVELCLAKALELMDWRSIPLLLWASSSEKSNGDSAYYSMLSAASVRYWNDYFDADAKRHEAEKVVNSARSLEDLLAFRIGAVRVGGHAVATTCRRIGSGTLNLESNSLIDRVADDGFGDDQRTGP